MSGCNQEAHQWIMRWPDWSSYAVIVYGPIGSGKTHLGHIWTARAKAQIQPRLISDLKGNALIDHIETIEPKMLLHFLNLAKENGWSLLLTSVAAPKKLPFTLPDLTSRLLALPATPIAPPDDEALAAVMRKQFSDRQLKVDEEVIAYIAPRIERSFSKISELVEILDRASLADRKNITIPFVRKTLGY